MADLTENIRTLFQQHQARHYELTGSGVNLKSPEAEDRSVEDTFDLFLSHYAMLTPGNYKILFWQNANGKKGAGTYSFYRSADTKELAAIAGNVDGNYNPNHPMQQMQSQLFELRLQAALDKQSREYEDRIRKLEEKEGGIGIGDLKEIIGPVIALATRSNNPTVSGPDRVPARPKATADPNPAAPTFGEKLQSLANSIGQEKLLEIIDMMEAKAKEDPQGFLGKIETAKQFL